MPTLLTALTPSGQMDSGSTPPSQPTTTSFDTKVIDDAGPISSLSNWPSAAAPVCSLASPCQIATMKGSLITDWSVSTSRLTNAAIRSAVNCAGV